MGMNGYKMNVAISLIFSFVLLVIFISMSVSLIDNENERSNFVEGQMSTNYSKINRHQILDESSEYYGCNMVDKVCYNYCEYYER